MGCNGHDLSACAAGPPAQCSCFNHKTFTWCWPLGRGPAPRRFAYRNVCQASQ